MRNTLTTLLSVLACAGASSIVSAQDQHANSSPAPRGELQIEIQSPIDDIDSVDGQATIEVEGIASAIGGVQYIDMMFVMDTSQSLRGTDPNDFRSAGAVGLVRNLSPKSDIKIGVVSFNNKGELAQPLSSNRDKVVLTLQGLSRSGSTDLAAGIRTALAELEKNGRTGSSRVIMLFTDGKSSRRTALAATREAQLQRVTIQTLLLGSSKRVARFLTRSPGERVAVSSR